MRNYENYDGWKERDVLIHKCINWEERNWEEFDTEETIMMPIKVYGKDYDSKKFTIEVDMKDFKEYSNLNKKIHRG